jgi:hypothetical protein
MANRVILLFNRFLNPYGGSEREALTLADPLRAHGDVTLWATSARNPATLRDRHGIEKIIRHARRTVEALYSRSALTRRAQFYLGHTMALKTA